MSYVSPVTGEEPYSGPYQNVLDVLRVMNIGEGRMAQLDEPTIHRFQETVDRDCDSILSSAYQVPIRAYNLTKPVDTGTLPIPGHYAGGVQAITPGNAFVIVSGQAWNFLPTSIIVTVLAPTGGLGLLATVDEDTITMDGFTTILSGVAGVGYSLSYFVSEPGTPGSVMVGVGTQVRVFPGDVRRAALY